LLHFYSHNNTTTHSIDTVVRGQRVVIAGSVFAGRRICKIIDGGALLEEEGLIKEEGALG